MWISVSMKRVRMDETLIEAVSVFQNPAFCTSFCVKSEGTLFEKGDERDCHRFQMY